MEAMAPITIITTIVVLTVIFNEVAGLCSEMDVGDI